MIAQLFLNKDQYQTIIEHVNSRLPEEACGLIGGRENEALLAIPVENELHSKVRFRMEPQAQLAALVKIENSGMDLIAIFHSHPMGPIGVSPTDIAEFSYPGTVSVILSPVGEGWQIHCYWIENRKVDEVTIVIDGYTDEHK